MKKGSQVEKIAFALLSGRVLTMLDIFMLAGSLNGHKRIADLRAKGFDIHEGWKEIEYDGQKRKVRCWYTANGQRIAA